MLRFVIQKLLNRRWMAICLLIGNMLMIAVAASNPVYSEAVLQRTLSKTLSATLETENTHPAELNLQTSLVTFTEDKKNEYFQVFEDFQKLPDKLGLPMELTVWEHEVELTNAVLLGDRATGKQTRVDIGYLEDFQNNSEIVSGQFPSTTVTDGVIEAVLSERLLAQKNLLVGESFELKMLKQPDGTPYQLKVVGVYRAKAGSELFWDRTGSTLSTNFVISEEVFDEIFRVGDTYPHGIYSRCTIYLDYTALTPEQTDHVIEVLQDFKVNHSVSWIAFNQNLSSQLLTFRPEATRLKGTLTVLQAPIFALLAAFIFMVSKQMMEMEENEIAVLKSRGSKKAQILGIYSLQSGILALTGLLLGYPLSFLICHMLGSSNAFMEFVQRTALPIRMSWTSLLYALVAGVAAIVVMTIPVTRYTGMTIVQHKVRKHSNTQKPMWQRLFLDIILLAVSLYSLYTFNGQKAYLAGQMVQGNALDPFLYFSSSLFILGVGLFGIRIAPLIMKLVYFIGKKRWAPAIYTAFLRVLRNTKNQSFIMTFLIMTIALGIFNTASARSINGNAEAEVVYLNGADVVVQEVWVNLGGASSEDSGDSMGKVADNYIEPAFEKYNNMEGVVSATKVYFTDENIKAIGSGSAGRIDQVSLMGIEPKRFGETATFDETLLSIHWYNYLNALAIDPTGVLVSSSFRDEKGYEVGDAIAFDVGDQRIRGTIYGFVDYWPGFTTQYTSEDGVSKEQYLVVANLATIQQETGIQPYQVWLKVEGSSQGVYDYTAEKGLRFSMFKDTAADLIELKNGPVLQGTNGVLTSNFIIVLLLCAVGFLIYWILSIRSRELQFGIFRAMGMSMKEIIVMLVCEQILISGSSILIGVVAGNLATELFLPLIQIAYSGTDQVLPIRMITYTSDSVRLFVIIALMIIGCMAVLAWLISKIRIAQALKLGED